MRRQIDDFGYWYSPCGRSSREQEQFEQVEARPQGLEKLFCEIWAVPFSPSLDDFSGRQASAGFLEKLENAYIEMKTTPPNTPQRVLEGMRYFISNISTYRYFLAGCNELERSITPSQSDLDRVAGILGQPPEKMVTNPFSRVGPPQIRLSETRIRFANALELAECGLLPLIAERNSSLGKQKQESSRLIYEWKVRAGLSKCLELQDKEWFQLALNAKQHDVEAAVIELLTNSEEADRIHTKVSPHSRL